MSDFSRESSPTNPVPSKNDVVFEPPADPPTTAARLSKIPAGILETLSHSVMPIGGSTTISRDADGGWTVAGPLARQPDSETLAAAAHHAMCEVSHHDSQSVCKNQRRYELIAVSMYSFMQAGVS